MSTTLPFPQLERIYDELALAIDHAGPRQESVFLTKLVLCLAHELGDGDRISRMIADCQKEAPSTKATQLI